MPAPGPAFLEAVGDGSGLSKVPLHPAPLHAYPPGALCFLGADSTKMPRYVASDLTKMPVQTCPLDLSVSRSSGLLYSLPLYNRSPVIPFPAHPAAWWPHSFHSPFLSLGGHPAWSGRQAMEYSSLVSLDRKDGAISDKTESNCSTRDDAHKQKKGKSIVLQPLLSGIFFQCF